MKNTIVIDLSKLDWAALDDLHEAFKWNGFEEYAKIVDEFIIKTQQEEEESND